MPVAEPMSKERKEDVGEPMAKERIKDVREPMEKEAKTVAKERKKDGVEPMEKEPKTVVTEGEVARQGQVLIPGLPNEVTVEHIATKVSWRSLCHLASLSKALTRAIGGREVYDARIQARSTQTLVAFSLDSNTQQGLYDLGQKWMCRLPPLPSLPNSGRPGNLQTAVETVLLDGKIFVFGDFFPGYEVRRRRYVHMLDLAACQFVWKECPRTTIRSRSTVCVGCDGKIYSFCMVDRAVRGAIFDPQNNIWTKIEEKPLNICNLFSYEGRVASLKKNIYFSSSGEFLMVFNTCTESWKVLNNTIPNRNSVSWVVVHEKLYNLSDSSVHVYDPSTNSWQLVQPISYENFKHDGAGFTPYTVKAAPVGGEVLALLEHNIIFADGCFRKLCKSVGFGIRGCPLVWEILPCDDLQRHLNKLNNFLVGTIEL